MLLAGWDRGRGLRDADAWKDGSAVVVVVALDDALFANPFVGERGTSFEGLRHVLGDLVFD